LPPVPADGAAVKTISLIVAFFAVILTDCAVRPSPEIWVRIDHTHVDAAAVAAASAECRAQAQLIGSQRGALRPVILAQ
jgi:hypothetical protein